jgi:hypothetical protein
LYENRVLRKLFFEARERNWHEDGEICIERNHIIMKIVWVRM